MAVNPFSPFNTGVGPKTNIKRRFRSFNARVIYKAANGRPAVLFEFIGELGGSKGNLYKVNLNRINATPRFGVRVCDVNDNIIGTVAAVTDLNGMVALVTADSSLGPILRMCVIQNVNEAFTASVACTDAKQGRGGV